MGQLTVLLCTVLLFRSGLGASPLEEKFLANLQEDPLQEYAGRAEEFFQALREEYRTDGATEQPVPGEEGECEYEPNCEEGCPPPQGCGDDGIPCQNFMAACFEAMFSAGALISEMKPRSETLMGTAWECADAGGRHTASFDVTKAWEWSSDELVGNFVKDPIKARIATVAANNAGQILMRQGCKASVAMATQGVATGLVSWIPVIGWVAFAASAAAYAIEAISERQVQNSISCCECVKWCRHGVEECIRACDVLEEACDHTWTCMNKLVCQTQGECGATDGGFFGYDFFDEMRDVPEGESETCEATRLKCVNQCHYDSCVCWMHMDDDYGGACKPWQGIWGGDCQVPLPPICNRLNQAMGTDQPNPYNVQELVNDGLIIPHVDDGLNGPGPV